MGFEFKSKTIELDIAGNTFTLEMNNDLQIKMDELSKRAFEVAAEMEKFESYSDALKRGCEVFSSEIDRLLGAGACARIFEGRAISYFDLTDVAMYAINEINGHMNRRISQYKQQAQNARHPYKKKRYK
jgi:hypothetical protein|nr:MAG TPA: tail assembly chaperone protein [Caudoviricetes sp.]